MTAEHFKEFLYVIMLTTKSDKRDICRHLSISKVALNRYLREGLTGKQKFLILDKLETYFLDRVQVSQSESRENRLKFTLDWYLQQKDKNIKDVDIAKLLSVCYGTLQNLKRKHGWVFGSGRIYSGRKKEFDDETIRRFRKNGMSCKEIMNELGCSKYTVWKAIRGA